LFQCHFLLFHFLYRIRDKWRKLQRKDLNIHVMNIALLFDHRASSCSGLEVADPLRDYYLDTKNLELSAAAIDELLSSFWQHFARAGVSGHERQESLDVLGLIDPVDQETIKGRYRKLARKHHPDRGGDAFKMQEINRAVSNLKEIR